jgi:hypothetical protein
MEHGERMALVVGVFEPSDIGLFGAYQIGELLLGKPGCSSGLANEFGNVSVEGFLSSSLNSATLRPDFLISARSVPDFSTRWLGTERVRTAPLFTRIMWLPV